MAAQQQSRITAQQARQIAMNDAIAKFDHDLHLYWDTSVMPTLDEAGNTYSVRFPLMGNRHGGEPSYTIDAATGNILSRRFTQ